MGAVVLRREELVEFVFPMACRHGSVFILRVLFLFIQFYRNPQADAAVGWADSRAFGLNPQKTERCLHGVQSRFVDVRDRFAGALDKFLDFWGKFDPALPIFVLEKFARLLFAHKARLDFAVGVADALKVRKLRRLRGRAVMVLALCCRNMRNRCGRDAGVWDGARRGE